MVCTSPSSFIHTPMAQAPCGHFYIEQVCGSKMAKRKEQSCFCTVERGRTEETITVVGNRMILAVYTTTWGHLMSEGQADSRSYEYEWLVLPPKAS